LLLCEVPKIFLVGQPSKLVHRKLQFFEAKLENGSHQILSPWMMPASRDLDAGFHVTYPPFVDPGDNFAIVLGADRNIAFEQSRIKSTPRWGDRAAVPGKA
jgi:hypothetical protein